VILLLDNRLPVCVQSQGTVAKLVVNGNDISGGCRGYTLNHNASEVPELTVYMDPLPSELELHLEGANVTILPVERRSS